MQKCYLDVKTREFGFGMLLEWTSKCLNLSSPLPLPSSIVIDMEMVNKAESPSADINLERQLLFSLKSCKEPVPCNWKEFSAFIKTTFEFKFPRKIKKAVWIKLKNLEDNLSGKEGEVIEISSGDEVKDLRDLIISVNIFDSNVVKSNEERLKNSCQTPISSKYLVNEEGITKKSKNKNKKLNNNSKLVFQDEGTNKTSTEILQYERNLDMSINIQDLKTDISSWSETTQEIKPNSIKQKRKKKSRSSSAERNVEISPRRKSRRKEDVVEELRRNLLVEKLIELSRPDLKCSIEKSKKKKKKRNTI